MHLVIHKPRVKRPLFLLLAVLGITPAVSCGGTLPNLGSGDPRLIAGLLGESLTVTIVARDIEKFEGEWDGSNIDPSKVPELMIPYWQSANPDDFIWTGFYRCYPFGAGRCFVRVSRGPIKLAAGALIWPTNVLEIAWTENKAVARAVTPDELEERFGVKRDSRFLGELDGKSFWWNPRQPEAVYYRDRGNGLVFEWHIKDLRDPDGVVRGNSGQGSFGLAGGYRVHRFLQSAPYGFDIREVSTKHAIEVKP